MRSRLGPTWISLPALAGACAALLVPGATTSTAAGAALLAVGAIALLAGHAWGLLVSIPSHVTLVGRVWPSLTVSSDGSPATAAAVAVVLVTALPALALTAVVLPQISRHVVGDSASPRVHAAVVAVSALGLAAALIVPAL
jgi:hypothetical protein